MTRTLKIRFFAFAMAGASLLLSQAALAQDIDVVIGGQQVLDFERPIDRIAVSDPAIADVEIITSRELRLLGLSGGSSDLSVWLTGPAERRDYRLNVGADLDGLRAALRGDSELQNVTAFQSAGRVTVQGTVPNLDARQRLTQYAHAYAGENINDMVSVTGRRMVAVEVRFAAVSMSVMKALGLNFQSLDNNFQFASAAPNTLTNFQFTPGTGLDLTTSLPLNQAFNLLLASPGADFMGVISALDNANLAQLLAEPTLLVRSGESASFLAGGEIPIPVPQGGNTGSVGIEYKKFGVQLNVEATVLSDDRIVIKASPEVSELDYANALTIQGFNVPAIRSRATSTTVELGDGQSFILAGLMYSSSSNVEDKLPGIGDLPIIGPLFRRTQNVQDRQELIIVATPRLVSPMENDEVPLLPGEDIPPHNPNLAETLFSNQSLEDYAVQHGLAR